MQLYEKLTFIMNLTQTSNRMMAKALRVDPSLISRLRTGARGIPRNREHLKEMADYLSKRCTTEYQYHALSEVMAVKFSPNLSHSQRSDLIYYWFCDEAGGVDRFMQTFENLHAGAVKPDLQTGAYSLATGNVVYYDNAGKRTAARSLYHHLLSLDKPAMVFLYFEESDDWITEDYEFSNSLQEWGLTLIERGFRICHIMSPVISPDQALESLSRWLALYITGQVAAYYYPRIRDNVHRRSLIVVSGVISMTSNSLAGRRASYATFLSTDSQLIASCETEFQDYMALCRPMMAVYSQMEELTKCFTQFLLTTSGSRIQKLISLSAETTPPELLSYCVDKMNNPDLSKLGPLYTLDLGAMEEKRHDQELIDIVFLASANSVRAGRVPIMFSFGSGQELLYYTPELYCLHLKNILRLLDNCETYHFIPLDERMKKHGNLMVREGQKALLVHTAPPFTVFEIDHPDIVLFCHEYLTRIADKVNYTGVYRGKIKAQIRNLIHELQS